MMVVRRSATAATAITVLAAAATLAACGASRAGSGSQLPPAPASSPPRNPTVIVHLGAVFSPSSLQLRVRQQFLVVVSRQVQVTGLPGPGGCTQATHSPVAGGLLSVRCTASGYRYTALRPGRGEISAMVRPRCASGTACPQWITAPTLKIAITRP